MVVILHLLNFKNRGHKSLNDSSMGPFTCKIELGFCLKATTPPPNPIPKSNYCCRNKKNAQNLLHHCHTPLSLQPQYILHDAQDVCTKNKLQLQMHCI